MMMRACILIITTLFTVSSFAETPLPVEQLRKEFLGWKYGLFLHFNVSTFNERSWSSGFEDPASFAPTDLDCDQWADVAVDVGMKYAVLTVKHTGGWCLWDSKYTDHDVTAFSNYKNGKGDIVREFTDACRERGLKVGLYYCFPGDFATRKKLVPEGEEDPHGLPPEAKGDFVGFIKKQMTELLTEYGKIDLIWADQYSNQYTRDGWLEIMQHIKSIQPNCIVIANNSLDFQETDIQSYEYPWLKTRKPERMLPPEDNAAPAELCDILGPGWFWSSKETSIETLKSAEEIAGRLNLCNRRNTNYLLNVAPDKTGRIPDYSVERLKEIKKLAGRSL